VHFRSRPETGTIVHLEKQLQFEAGSPVVMLAERGSDTIALDLHAAHDAIAERDEALDGPTS
jgi:hypothetical protein